MHALHEDSINGQTADVADRAGGETALPGLGALDGGTAIVFSAQNTERGVAARCQHDDLAAA